MPTRPIKVWDGTAWIDVGVYGPDTSGFALTANNLADLASASTALSNLGGTPTTRTITAGTGLTGGGDLSANRTLSVSFGSTSTTACVGDDSRLSDARTPTAGYPFGFAYAMDPRTIGAVGNVNASNNCWFVRLVAGATISKVGFQVGNQSGNVSVAAYRNTGTGRSAAPGTRLATSGAVSCPATGYAEVALDSTVTVAAGDWLAISADNTTATFACFAGYASNFPSGAAGYQGTAHPAPSSPSLTVSAQRMYVLIGVP